ncbi:MAG: glycosyltransferase [Opitutales bacterium]|nr:glycosyltransferase [Opitutales bacterium]
MKILYVSAFRKKVKTNNTLRVESLRGLGNNVEIFDETPYIYRFGRFSSRALHHFNLELLVKAASTDLIKQATVFKPDLIWFDKGRFIPKPALLGIRETIPKIKLVHYNPDDPFGHQKINWSMFIKAIPEYDVHLIPNAIAEDDYRSRGAKKIIVFDRSFSPSIHRPLSPSQADQEKFGARVGFIGSWAPAREAAIAHLIQRGIPVAVYGVQWNKGKHWEVIRPHYRGPSQWGDDYAKAIGGMDIALHFLRQENRDEQDSRTFEIPACRTFMLAERSPAHERLFTENKEAVFFDTVDELEQKVRYYLENPKEREKIAENGYQKCWSAGYDHCSRLKQLLNHVT